MSLRSGRTGFTLPEVVVVLAILVVAAGVVALRAGSVRDGARTDGTRLILGQARAALSGPIDRPGFREDLGELPVQLADLFVAPAALPSGKPVAPFDPYTGRGWNGPYLTPTAAGLIDGWGKAIVLQRPATPGITPSQQEQFARLVSAGPNGVIDTSASLLAPDVLDKTQVGDDVVVYVLRSNGPGP